MRPSILPFLATRTSDGKPATWSGPLAALNPHLVVRPWVVYRLTGDPLDLKRVELLDAEVGTERAAAQRAAVEALDLETLPRVTLRPIGAGIEAEACELEAGEPEGLGQMLLTWCADQVPASTPDKDRALAVQRVIDARPPEDRAAMQRFQLRLQRLARARLARALVALDGESRVNLGGGEEPDRWLTPIEVIDELPELLRVMAMAELADHLDRISRLGTEGKARAGRA